MTKTNQLRRLWRPILAMTLLGLVIEIYGVFPWFGIMIPDMTQLLPIFSVLGIQVACRTHEKLNGVR